MIWGLIVIFTIIGFIVGLLFETPKRYKRRPVGTLRLDNSDPDGPFLFLELTTPLENVTSQKQVTVYVNTENYIPQD